jgi:hypothetical protein
VGWRGKRHNGRTWPDRLVCRIEQSTFVTSPEAVQSLTLGKQLAKVIPHFIIP